MAFEIGKDYVFRQNDFEISRESGKLYFLVHDPASGNVCRIKPFDFQTSAIPEKLTCTYIGDDKFEQKTDSVIPLLYKPGETYKFRIMRIDNTTGSLSLRDDINGINHFPVELGRHRFQRFQRITCMVTDITDGRLTMEYVHENSTPTPFFTLSDLISQLPEATALERHKVISQLIESTPFSEARVQLENKNSAWLVTALEIIDSNITQWAGANLNRRMNWFDRLRTLLITLIEQSPYLNLLPREERARTQERLSSIIRNCEDSLHAARLIHDGQDEEVITATLSSLSHSGWLYNPEKKMRTIMAIFNFRPNVDDSYIGEIFRIIKDNYNDKRFREVFGNGFIDMLNIYITHESKVLDPYNRASLRKLAEAIAIELLLTADREFEQWNNHRGLLYTIASLLIRKTDTHLTLKAMEAFAQRLDINLEFGWRDLDDITRLCYTKLDTPMRATSRRGAETAFEGEAARITIDNSRLTVAPALTGTNTRNVATYTIGSQIDVNIMANGRLSEKTGNSADIHTHHLFWNELEKTLFDTKLKPVAAVAAVPHAKTAPEIGSEVTIRITSRDFDDEHLFHCVIEDDDFEGEGSLTTRDIVQYPVKAYLDTFAYNGHPMLLKATVTEQEDNGKFRFSMRTQTTAEALRMANNDRDSQDAIKAVITGETDKFYLAVTNGGYPVSIYRRPDSVIAKNSGVWVIIKKVNYAPAKDTIYVAASIDGFDDETSPEENYHFVKESFSYLLQETCERRTYTVANDTDNVSRKSSTGSECDPEAYLGTREVSYMVQLLDSMALINSDNLTEAYTILAIARLIALTGGDLYRAEYLAIKMSLVEALSAFTINGRVEKTAVDTLAHRCANVAKADSDIKHKLAVLQALASIDGTTEDTIRLANRCASSDDTINTLRRLVVSYNLTRGLGIDNLRRELIKSVFDHLNLQMPDIDNSKVNETEDQYHEFKESLIYPAGNNMKADDKRQIRELMEVTCGFLNSEGGTLYIGVNNSGVPTGLDNDFRFLNNGYTDYDLRDARDKFNLCFCKGLRDHFGITINGTPLYPDYVSIEHEEFDGKPVCRIVIKPFPGMVRMTDNSVFVRQDTSTIPLKTTREQNAFEKKRISSNRI